MDGKALQGMLRRTAGKPVPTPLPVSRVLTAWRRAAENPPADLVVVEAGESRVHAVRVTRRRGAPARAVAASRTIPPDLDPAERAARERQALGAIVTELGARGLPAVAALGGPDVIVRRLSMPRLQPADLASALALECRKQVTYPLADAVIRHEVIEGAVGRDELAVVVAIAPRHRVDAWRTLLAATGLRPWSLTIAAAGLRADLARRDALSARDVVAYLDIGHDASQIVVLKGRDIRFSRDLAFGVSTMTSALQQIVVPGVGTLERSPEEAATLLREHGIPTGADEAAFAGEVPLAAVSIMLRPALERLVRELWNSFDYCNEQFLGEAVSRVVLLGPGRRIPNLASHLTGVLKMPVSSADAFGGEGRSAASIPTSDEIAGSGAALASIGRGTLNFLSGTPAGQPLGWLADAIPAPAVAAVAAVLLVSIAAPAELNVARVKARVATLRSELDRFAAQRDAVARFRNALEEEERLRALLTRLTGSQVLWSFVLRDLSHRVGPDARLTALEVREPPARTAAAAATGGVPPAPIRSVRLSGFLRTPDASPEGALAVLLRSLAASPAFDQVHLEGCQRVSPALSSFTLTARLAEGPGS